jgi:hypothetical protein
MDIRSWTCSALARMIRQCRCAKDKLIGLSRTHGLISVPPRMRSRRVWSGLARRDRGRGVFENDMVSRSVYGNGRAFVICLFFPFLVAFVFNTRLSLLHVLLLLILFTVQAILLVMATVSRNIVRALRSTPATSTFRPAARHAALPRQAFQRQARRGYAGEAPKSSGSNSTAIIGGLAVVALAGAGYFAFSGAPETVKQSSVDQGQKGNTVFSPTRQDYQKVYDAVAKRLIEEDDYDDGSYGPVLIRLGWHSSGTYDALTKTGGSNGATMRFPVSAFRIPPIDHFPSY